MKAAPFWETTPLEAMTHTEWESLCDGCGLCCLHKFEDIETEALEFTCVKCQHLGENRRCQVYSERVERVEGCLDIRDISRAEYRWLPESCAYRRLAEGKSLPDWHPLLTGDHAAMEAAGHCVGDWAISDALVVEVDEDFIVRIKASES